MTDMTPEHALQKLLATAEGNPFCPVGHLVEHGLGGADALRAALSRPSDTEASRTLDALIALASGDDGLPDDLRADVERLRAILSCPAVPAGITVWLEGKRLARVGREAPESSGDSESRAAFAQLARLAPAVPSAHWWYRDSTDEWVLELNAAGDDMSITHRWPGKTKDDALRAMDAPAVPEWIPVSERLPEPHTVVALMNEARFMNGPDDMDFRWHGVGYLDDFGEKYWSVIGERAMTLDAATHWMPLPAPPTQEEQE